MQLTNKQLGAMFCVFFLLLLAMFRREERMAEFMQAKPLVTNDPHQVSTLHLTTAEETPSPTSAAVDEDYVDIAEEEKDYNEPTTTNQPAIETTATTCSIMSYREGRNTKAVTSEMFARKQAILEALATGTFEPADAAKYTANHYAPVSPQARELYYKWSSLQRTKQCVENKRIFITGTSFQRSILWSVLRRMMDDTPMVPEEYKLIASVPSIVREVNNKTGKCMDVRVGKDKYESRPVPWKTTVPSCLHVKNSKCEHPGPAGIELGKCGLPMSAQWTSANNNDTVIHYQFKTYILAPAVDNHIYTKLKSNNDGPWDVIWVESGEWGSWGSAYEREHSTAWESLDFLRRLLRSTSGWVVVSGNSKYTEQNLIFLNAAKKLAERYGERILVFDQKQVVAEGRKRKIPEAHGYYGTMTDVMVRIFFALVCDEEW